ncbi:MAG TPA: SusC/RagA family TonB-linked outer membrane protein, partial [Bacteroidales bacterium]|nr:SusC/RagA family TonB-linked outer membrane protein [Bacteroidales bacterium]
MNKKIFILLVTVLAVIFPASGQVTEVTGSVTSAADQTPIPGVTIYIKGETTGTITDASGRYSLQVKKGDVLVFSFVGMETKEIPFTGQSTINVELTTSKESLDEVVVVGYGTRKKSLVTGAISTVTEADIDQGINLRAEQALQGRTAGVVITNNSGQPGDNVSIRIRGTSTPNGAQPLILVDGVPVGGIDYLNPGDIARIEVLKDAASSAIYGTRGANGVVLITTKQGSKNKPAQFRYDGYYGIQNPWRKMDLLNAKQYAQVLNEAYFNDNKPLPFSGDDILKLGAGTDWQEEVFYRNAPVTSHEFSVTGGTEKTAYATSFSYFSQDGIVAKGKSNFDRYTFRANGNHDLYNGRFKVSESVAYSHINRKGIDANG